VSGASVNEPTFQTVPDATTCRRSLVRRPTLVDPAANAQSEGDAIGGFATPLEVLVGGIAWAFVITYAAVAIARLTYPFDLDWMEGGSVDHVRRILTGQPIYVAPTLAFVPYPYPPLYYYTSAAVASVTGIGFFPLRLVSLVSSLASFALVYLLVERETKSRYAATVALGIFAATYRISGAWFDVARVDSLFLMLSLGAAYLARWGATPRAYASAGVLLALAVLTKQTALGIALPLLLYALVSRPRHGVILLAVFAAVFAGATAALAWKDHRWYLYHVVRLPAQIQLAEREGADFWTRDIAGALPIVSAVSAALLCRLRPWFTTRTLFIASLSVGMIGSAWAARLHSGAYENVLIPAYAALAVLFGLGCHSLVHGSNGAVRDWRRVAVAICAGVQLALLRYDPAAQIPSRTDRELQRQLAKRIEASGSSIYAPQHAYIPTAGGAVTGAHAWPISDILRSAEPRIQRQLRDDISRAIRSRKFRVIVLDKVEPWLQPELDEHYELTGPAVDGDGLWTRTGYHTHPRWIYQPR
jgi:4-amino-4-deoxy-L-arabinose transferase-like glycosyltransferase